MKNIFLCIILVFSTINISGCVAGSTHPTMSMQGETAATPFHLISDAPVTVSPIRVYVKPTVHPTTPLKGLFVPLRVTQDMASPKQTSYNISRQIYQVWVAQSAFAALEYDDRLVPFQVTDALQLARSRGANVLVGGYIAHFLDAGSSGTSAVSIQIEMYEVASGNLIWSMGQGASMEKRQPTDLFSLGIEQRMPADAAGLMVRSVGYDLGEKIQQWVRGPQGTGKGQVF